MSDLEEWGLSEAEIEELADYWGLSEAEISDEYEKLRWLLSNADVETIRHSWGKAQFDVELWKESWAVSWMNIKAGAEMYRWVLSHLNAEVYTIKWASTSLNIFLSRLRYRWVSTAALVEGLLSRWLKSIATIDSMREVLRWTGIYSLLEDIGSEWLRTLAVLQIEAGRWLSIYKNLISVSSFYSPVSIISIRPGARLEPFSGTYDTQVDVTLKADAPWNSVYFSYDGVNWYEKHGDAVWTLRSDRTLFVKVEFEDGYLVQVQGTYKIGTAYGRELYRDNEYRVSLMDAVVWREV